MNEKLYPNGKTQNEILRSSISRREMAAQLGVTLSAVAIMRAKLGITKKYKPALGSLKGRDIQRIMELLSCPRCGNKTENDRDGAAIYCAAIKPDGTRCMYHYTRLDLEAAFKSAEEAGEDSGDEC